MDLTTGHLTRKEYEKLESDWFRATGNRMGQAVLCALLIVTAFLGVACGQTDPTPSPTPEPVDPKGELQRTRARLSTLQSVSFDLEHLVGTTEIIPGVLMHRAYGSAVVPSTFEVTIESELKFPQAYLEVGMIRIKETAYMTSVLNGEWGTVPPQLLPIDLSDFGTKLADIVESVQNPEFLGEETLNGVPVYRISGVVLSEALSVLVPSASTGLQVSLEMWTERETGALVQSLITGQVVVSDVPDTQRKLTLKDIDQPVTVSPPDL